MSDFFAEGFAKACGEACVTRSAVLSGLVP
jgi:hypothetical protein